MPPPDRVIYVATTNAGKLRDFAAAADAFEVSIEPLPGLREFVEPEETGETFAANARLKSEYYSRLAPGLWVLADDSGLEVDALGGAPGVRSARFAADERFAGEPGMTADERNNACLLFCLAGVSSGAKAHAVAQANVEAEASAYLQARAQANTQVDANATLPEHPTKTRSVARYRCVLALARDGVVEAVAEGSVEGHILTSPRVDGGFGYDPLFCLPELGMSMAEIDLATKQRISHRGLALAELLRSMPPATQP